MPEKFKNKYLKYKILEKDIDIVPETPKKALLLFGKLKNAYSLRSKYRKEAFVPEKWDRGHDLRMSYTKKNGRNRIITTELVQKR